MRHKMKRNQSKLHRTGPYDACKISLSCFDDKKYILDDWSIFIKTHEVNRGCKHIIIF